MSIKKDEIKVVIPCGGKGSRLAEHTDFTPKPLIPIGEHPILWHIMKHYSSYGFNNFLLCLGYKGEMIRDYFLRYQFGSSTVLTNLMTREVKPICKENWEVQFFNTGAETKTGLRLGRIKEQLLDDNHFMFTYGDGVSDLDIEKSVEFHLSKGDSIDGTITIAHPTSRYGVVEVNSEGRVESFSEKPIIKHSWMNIGFMIFNRKFLDNPMLNKNVMLEDILEDLTRRGRLTAFKHEGFFHSMDTPRDYSVLNEMYDEGKAPWKKW